MSYSSGNNPDVVKTLLDDVFMAEWNAQETHPGYATVDNSSLFHQESVDMAAYSEEIFGGVGLWDTRQEEADVKSDNPLIKNQITYTVANYAKSIDISKNFFDDNKHGAYEKMVRDFAMKAKATKNHIGFGIYRDGFTATTTADGAYLFSDTHTTINGGTVDNKLTAALSTSSLEDAIIALVEQKDQSDVIMGNTPDILLVPTALFKEAVEFTGSELLPGTGNNNINWVSSKYGIQVLMSNRLGTAAGGDDRRWYLMSRNHAVKRFVRQEVETRLVDWANQRNNNYIYKGEYREVYGASDYCGAVGSDGTT